MKKLKKRYIFLGVIAVLWCAWMWEVGFNTGKYSRQETPFNVPARIVKSMREGAAIEKIKPQLVANSAQLTVGKSAPDFSLPGQEEQIISLSDFRGKVLLIDFWASWCGSCRKSNSYFLDLYERQRNNNFEILSISIDRSLSAWKKAIKQDNIIWPQACDGLGVNSDVVVQYGIQELPHNFLLDEEGIILGKDLSPAAIDKWLAENR